MKFVLIFGPQAVGKMTVGQELAKLTGLKLFHNHMTIEMLEPLFGFSPELWELSSLFRKEIFKTIANGDSEGLIFTYVWAFDMEEDWDFVNQTCEIFESRGGTVYFVELKADMVERVKRNKSPHRLKHKATKRNVDWSENELRETMARHRLNSYKDEIKKENYLLIDNTNLGATEVADIISDQFKL